MTNPLAAKRCIPCEGDTPALSPEEVEDMLVHTPEWFSDADVTTIARTFTFKNFGEGIEFVMKVAEIAEEENHHPDIHIHQYKHVTIALTTHAIGGLSENDFIVAAKIDALEV